MTGRREGCVSTMLTQSGLSIAPPVRHIKALCHEKQGARRQAQRFGVLSVLTARVATRGERHVAQSQRGSRPGRNLPGLRDSRNDIGEDGPILGDGAADREGVRAED
jgi:hypothetical protein